ncbi:RHS repeat domain-containing protein [Pseudomonas cucumis]|uniref:RHS repeat domain-containing protein n=1 Tax=Pseudomonas cucumis TaxID=2954082 RepID=UPI002733CD04|nr:RHS repeat-associated core domain-containing protein [Pseudomonas cucumis]WLG89279.1 RHS repeat-associated core domain-containing protein [Pseudomonas cucumis]
MTSSIYRRTPSLNVIDGRGLPIRQIAYLRTVAGETAIALVTRQQHDAAGRLVAQWDPRLSRPNLATVYGLGGDPLKIDSVDAGWRLSLPGLAGEALQRWDARGSHWRTTYDNQLRVVTVEENAQPDVETFTYADAVADAHHNLRGQLLEQVDPSGTLRFDSYSLLGQPLRETRTFHDAQAFVSCRTYSPLGAVLEQIDAGDHRQRSRYDLAGQLKYTELQLKGQTAWKPVLQNAQYNPAGQIIEQTAGNSVISRWTYDAANARLQRQRTQKDQQPPLQDFEYEYDPVGNITRILDRVFTPSHFANQRVDGHREFSYDSLYRLHSASGYDDGPPSDIPGQPQPTDPNDRRNYTQTYEYDHGDNLIKLSHVRDGACHTREMFIDPASNRGVRRTPNDPDPDLDKLFDRHGNLLALQPGQPLHWNNRDELASVTLVHRDNGPNDEEHYRYSQGARVYKRHETHTTTNTHFHKVHYLPGLEIRTRDNGEELHVITLAAGIGSVRCLHWVTGKPADIDADQLRYTLDDHLGSCLMELDQQAQLISHEGYYPFGATAWMAARSVTEVAYKFVRYSGKEMDVSGLYYYGARFYAPWLQRWISADPAGDVDGLNLYAFVRNSPIVFTDNDGRSLGNFIDGFLETNDQQAVRKTQSASAQNQYKANMNLSAAIERHTKILELTTRRAKEAETQILNHQSARAHGQSAAIRTVAHIGGQAISYAAGIGIGTATAALGSVAGPVGVAVGIFLGIAAKKAVSLGVDFASERLSLSASVKFKAGKLDPNRIVTKGEYKAMNYSSYAINKFKGITHGVIELNKKGWLKGSKEVVPVGASIGMKAANTPFASEVSAVLSTVTGTFEILHEITGAGLELTQEKMARGNANISRMIDVLNAGVSELESLFEQAGRSSIHTYKPLSKLFGNASGDTLQSMRSATDATIAQLKRTQTLLKVA